MFLHSTPLPDQGMFSSNGLPTISNPGFGDSEVVESTSIYKQGRYPFRVLRAGKGGPLPRRSAQAAVSTYIFLEEDCLARYAASGQTVLHDMQHAPG
ncbi:hypothetical protein LTR16_003367, partial [Cryomyces antarcticus]